MKKIVLAFLVFISFSAFSQKLSVGGLSCENAERPLGIEAASPSLSWKLLSDARGVRQTAYHILVADDSLLLKQNKGNVWDSKKVTAERSIHISYAGKRLQAAKTYYWKVMVWDNQKNVSAWSKISQWQMGLLNEDDWKKAKWIGYEELPDSLYVVPAEHQRGPAKWQGVKDVLPLLRTTFAIQKPVKKATAFVCGLGHFDLSANGQ